MSTLLIPSEPMAQCVRGVQSTQINQYWKGSMSFAQHNRKLPMELLLRIAHFMLCSEMIKFMERPF